MSFLSDENKSFIWNIIYEGGGFNDIPESRIDNVKNLLDNKFIEINNFSSNKTKLELNKLLLKAMFNDLKLYKINENMSNSLRKENNVTEFNKKLNDHQNNMAEFLNIKYPEKPNFEDDIKNLSNISTIELDKTYDNFLKQREDELVEILPNPENIKNINSMNNINNKLDIEKNKISFLDLTQELFNNSIENTDNINHTNNTDNINNINNTDNTNNINDTNNINNINNKKNRKNNQIEYIKLLEKKNNNINEIETDNKFNIHNKLNMIIKNQGEIIDHYNDLLNELFNIKILLNTIIKQN